MLEELAIVLAILGFLLAGTFVIAGLVVWTFKRFGQPRIYPRTAVGITLAGPRQIIVIRVVVVDKVESSEFIRRRNRADRPPLWTWFLPNPARATANN